MKSRPRRPFLNKLAIIFVPILMIGFSLFMWAWQGEPRRVETVTAAMEMPQWKRKEGPPLRIAIAGDFHLRPNGGDLAHKYMETIMEARPDMIFLLGDYAKQTGAAAVVKGLRALSDFEYEFQQALTNKSLCPQLETVFLTAKGENMFLSSSMVKEVCRLDGDISAFVPKEILDDIIARCKGER